MTKQTLLFSILLTAGALVGGVALAIPHEFRPDQPISASQVNANFEACSNDISAMQARLEAYIEARRPVALSVRKSGPFQTDIKSPVIVTFNEVDLDTEAGFSSSRYTVKQPGYYRVDAALTFNNANLQSGEYVDVFIIKNGTAISRARRTWLQGGGMTYIATAVTVELAVDDILEVQASSNNGTGAQIDSANDVTWNSFSLSRL